MRILIIGPGRAGGALALAAAAAGHEICGLVARSPLRWELGFPLVSGSWPAVDLVMIATRDGEIAEAARQAANHHPPAAVVHLSGATSVSVLSGLAGRGWETGSFHPLQSLPDPQIGAGVLAGSWVGVTAGGRLRDLLRGLAASLGMHDFDLDDEVRSIYHSGAAAASNFLVAALDLAQQFFEKARVPFTAAEPLSKAVVGHAFALGARPSLTGPIVRQDWETVRLQRSAAAELGAEALRQFDLLAAATAIAASVAIPPDLRDDGD
ncbi:MAG TPA: DUF2520 domain-containing protein [Acidimicrobiia bacterium]|nr:DUF2520 domain-containing protein [Acidimicrobiia bacterium]